MFGSVRLSIRMFVCEFVATLLFEHKVSVHLKLWGVNLMGHSTFLQVIGQYLFNFYIYSGLRKIWLWCSWSITQRILNIDHRNL